MLEKLASRQLIAVTGKGGVGKSTVSAVLGRLLSRSGRRTMLVEVDPRESLHALLDVPPSGGEILRAAPRLDLQHLDPTAVIDELVRSKLKVKAIADRVTSSPVHRHFVEGAPGLKEAAIFGRCLRMVQGHMPRGATPPETVILDAPASGHGVQWMAAPQLVADVIQSGPVGQMATEVARFLGDTERFGVVVVTTAEEMPVQESLELLDALRARTGRPPDLVVVNALYPPVEAAGDAEPSGTDLWRRRREINDRELHRLQSSWTGPTARLPLLPVDVGPRLVSALADIFVSDVM